MRPRFPVALLLIALVATALTATGHRAPAEASRDRLDSPALRQQSAGQNEMRRAPRWLPPPKVRRPPAPLLA